MKQYVGNQYRISREMKAFRVEEADRLFFACRYEGSNEGFVIERDVFHRQMNRGRIVPSMNADSVTI
ncbi:hypothetical protein PP175_22055 [Aneurinibacillus sp. Ricciae_BoGa-3]|uniref:hypothetical protein n=1 Tax=Aneurinibacillus sp. Ricciae_BoGa-3 TaxID=3022697 RepID=UPI002341C946|nr:hypothetical protein [Aneurinibacillus sp. Ricciae_BoGa-3]WCK53974.1 hypothetical protein PP175_22055 [Aneurinibacillus sp. Ricciae_BoGa-3]